jgi:cell wall-associated NlpC family hydrolase
MNKHRIRNFVGGTIVAFSLLAAGTVAMPTAAVQAATVSSSTLAQQIIATGEKYMGTPYKYGAAAGQTNTFDCSSFTQYVYKQNGIDLPRSSKQQSQVGSYVARSDLQPGDLVFFYSPIHHVAIYIGNGKLLHTFGKGGVTITSLNSTWWSEHYATARRVLPAAAAQTPSGSTGSADSTGSTGSTDTQTQGTTTGGHTDWQVPNNWWSGFWF